MRILNLATLEVDERSFAPVGTQSAWPTSDPSEFILAMHLPTGDGATSRFNYYVFNFRSNTLALVSRDPHSSTRYQYLAAIKRLAVIDNEVIQFLDKVPTGASQPADVAVGAFLDEMNQWRLARAAAMEMEAQSHPVAGSGGLGASKGVVERESLAAQLRESRVEGVGVYEGKGGRHGEGPMRQAGSVDIRVRRSSRPIALVLSSYEPVRWTISLEPGAKLSAVLLSGYHESTVVGAGAARVYQMVQLHAYDQQSPRYAELRRAVERWTGKSIGVFQGRYEGGSFFVGGD